jgi:hypothetical protein
MQAGVPFHMATQALILEGKKAPNTKSVGFRSPAVPQSNPLIPINEPFEPYFPSEDDL